MIGELPSNSLMAIASETTCHRIFGRLRCTRQNKMKEDECLLGVSKHDQKSGKKSPPSLTIGPC